MEERVESPDSRQWRPRQTQGVFRRRISEKEIDEVSAFLLRACASECRTRRELNPPGPDERTAFSPLHRNDRATLALLRTRYLLLDDRISSDSHSHAASLPTSRFFQFAIDASVPPPDPRYHTSHGTLSLLSIIIRSCQTNTLFRPFIESTNHFVPTTLSLHPFSKLDPAAPSSLHFFPLTTWVRPDPATQVVGGAGSGLTSGLESPVQSP